MNNHLDKDLLYAMFKFKKATSQISSVSDMRMNEALALAIIDGQCVENEKTLLAREVGETLCITHSAVSQMLTSLEKKGYICRDINEFDKRQYRFSLTEEGRQVTHQMKEQLDRTISIIISRFGEDNTITLTQMLSDFADLLTQVQNENKVDAK